MQYIAISYYLADKTILHTSITDARAVASRPNLFGSDLNPAARNVGQVINKSIALKSSLAVSAILVISKFDSLIQIPPNGLKSCTIPNSRLST
jgi:hypothetical protein